MDNTYQRTGMCHRPQITEESNDIGSTMQKRVKSTQKYLDEWNNASNNQGRITGSRMGWQTTGEKN